MKLPLWQQPWQRHGEGPVTTDEATVWVRLGPPPPDALPDTELRPFTVTSLGWLAGQLPGWIEALSTSATQGQFADAATSHVAVEERLVQLRSQAAAVMDAIQAGLRGKARETALARYQELWDQIERLGGESTSTKLPASGRIDVRYDRSVVEDFVRTCLLVWGPTPRYFESLRQNLDLTRVSLAPFGPRWEQLSG